MSASAIASMMGGEGDENPVEVQIVPIRDDYAGVPTAEIKTLYEQYIDTDLVTFADRIGMDERDLKKIVLTENYAFTGWTVTERILEGLGLDSSSLMHAGLLHEVPRAGAVAARKLAEDEFWARMETPSEAEMKARIEELIELRRMLCVKSPEQEARLKRDSERAQARQARLRLLTD